jgi:hypothetical protein
LLALKIIELRDMCKRKGVSTAGAKELLVARLCEPAALDEAAEASATATRANAAASPAKRAATSVADAAEAGPAVLGHESPAAAESDDVRQGSSFPMSGLFHHSLPVSGVHPMHICSQTEAAAVPMFQELSALTLAALKDSTEKIGDALLKPRVFRPLDIPLAICEQQSECNARSSTATEGPLSANGVNPLPFFPSIRRLAKVCEHQKPRRLCLSCSGLTNGDLKLPQELVSMPFSMPGSQSTTSSSVLKSIHKASRFQDTLHQSIFSPSLQTSFGPQSAPAEDAVALHLKRQIQSAAESFAKNRLKPSAPVRIVCMALLYDKTRCRMPGVFPDDGDLWFCSLHKDKQKYGIADQSEILLHP